MESGNGGAKYRGVAVTRVYLHLTVCLHLKRGCEPGLVMEQGRIIDEGVRA